jgi:plasmid stabilization system protein ParE
VSRQLILAGAARRDLDRIRAWYSQPGSGKVARQKVRRLISSIGALVEAPCRWPRTPDGAGRILVAEQHRVLYRATPDTGRNDTAGDVIVLRIFGPGQET